MRILSKKAVSDFEFRSRNFFSKITYVWDGFVQVTSAEDVATKSARIFHVLNILLILLMVLMSPEKITQMLMPTQSDSVIIDGIRNSVKLLRRLAPF